MAMTEEQYINKIYDAQKQSTLNTLKSAYDKNIASVDSAMSNLGTSAYEAKRQAAGEAALTRQRLNEQFAANGLNTGAAGQAHLALLNQQAANLNSIEMKRAQAENAYNAQKAALTQEYQSQIKSAILDNDADRAAALYKAWKEQQAALASGGSDRYYSPKKIVEDDPWKDWSVVDTSKPTTNPINLGYGPISPNGLANLVQSGAVSQSQDKNGNFVWQNTGKAVSPIQQKFYDTFYNSRKGKK